MRIESQSLDEMIEVLEACRDGKTIEFRYRNESWRECKYLPLFDFFSNDYRIKQTDEDLELERLRESQMELNFIYT